MHVTRISSCHSCIWLFIVSFIACHVLVNGQEARGYPNINNNNRRGVLHGDAGTPPPNGAASRPMPTTYPYPYPHPPPQFLTVTRTIVRTVTQLPTVSPHGMALSNDSSRFTMPFYLTITTILVGVVLVYI